MSRLIAESATRVSDHTDPVINWRIAAETRERLTTIGNDSERIRRRLRELDLEWDIERVIETNASALVVLGTVLGLRVHRAFFGLPLAVGAFLFQHAIHGWCPPVPILRRLGFRTEREIADERRELMRRLG